jgi:hypothetical protein
MLPMFRPFCLSFGRAGIVVLLLVQLGLDCWIANVFVQRRQPFDTNRKAWGPENSGSTVLRTTRDSGQIQAWIVQENRWVTLGTSASNP